MFDGHVTKTMLRYLYLLSLLLCIQLSFCYNYKDETPERSLSSYGRNIRRDRNERKLRRLKERKNLIRQEYDYDRSPVEFDVASFIQPDEDAVEDNDSYRLRNKKRRRTSKNFDYILGLNVDETNKKSDRSPDYLNLGETNPDLHLNQPLFKDIQSSINSKQNYNSLDELQSDNKYGHEKFKNIYKDDLLMDQNLVHNHEKKCTLKHIKFPFFSHNKSETITKPKKNKKRKLFCFNCPKKEDRGKLPSEEIKMGDDTMIQYKIKRSYQERLCPACKKLYVDVRNRRKKTPKRIIHTARQFYQNNFPESKIKEDSKNVGNRPFLEDSDSEYRKKRETDRDRQLKELEEVQRKVDNVNIHFPAFDKPTAQPKEN